MAKLWELLDRAYYYIDKNRFSEAQHILDEILLVDPQNMDAWVAYITISNTHHDLNRLRNHILKIWDSGVRDQDFLLATRRFVLNRLDEKINSL